MNESLGIEKEMDIVWQKEKMWSIWHTQEKL